MTENMTQKFAYEVVNGSVTIWRCFSRTEVAEIPPQIAGFPVTKIAPYAFSAHMNEDMLKGKSYTTEEEFPALCGNRLEMVRIPATVVQVGRYCFYNCNGLKKISFTDTLKDWGSGVFTGCHHVRELELHIYKEGRTTLKDVLMELPELVTVDYYLENGGDTQFARLVFPEFFEEGVENTPARNINTEMHGSGMYYRNCFQQRVLAFSEYDSRFEHAGFQESFLVQASLAEGRLRYPLGLSDSARRRYEQFLREKKEVFSGYMIEKKEMDALMWYVELLGQIYREEKDVIAHLVSRMTEQASLSGFHEALSYLMDYQHQHGKKKQKKSFDL